MKTLLLFSAFVFSLLSHTVSAQQITEDMLMNGNSGYQSYLEMFKQINGNFQELLVDQASVSVNNSGPANSTFAGPFSVEYFDQSSSFVVTSVMSEGNFIIQKFFHLNNSALYIDSIKTISASNPPSVTKTSVPLVYYSFPMNPGDGTQQIFYTTNVYNGNENVSDPTIFEREYIGEIDVITSLNEYSDLLVFRSTGFDQALIGNQIDYYFYSSENLFFPILTYIPGWGSSFFENISLTPLAIPEQKQQETISLFPNPSKNIITLKNIEEGKEVKIFSMSGEFIASIVVRQNSQISVDHLSSGMYILEIDSEKRIFIKD